jgi:hypothetical protein
MRSNVANSLSHVIWPSFSCSIENCSFAASGRELGWASGVHMKSMFVAHQVNTCNPGSRSSTCLLASFFTISCPASRAKIATPIRQDLFLDMHRPCPDLRRHTGLRLKRYQSTHSTSDVLGTIITSSSLSSTSTTSIWGGAGCAGTECTAGMMSAARDMYLQERRNGLNLFSGQPVGTVCPSLPPPLSFLSYVHSF